MGVELWEQTTWDKTQVLLGTWEQDENTLATREKQKKYPTHAPLK
jgi:hypothetical protein